MNNTRLKLMSRFYTEGNHLIHQIQLLNEEGHVVFSQDFRDYAEYRNTYGTLQRQVRQEEKPKQAAGKAAA